MERIANLHIKKLPEGAYPATSDDIPGLSAQGRTLTETLEIARDVAEKLLEAQAGYQVDRGDEGHLEKLSGKSGIGCKCPEMDPFPALSRQIDLLIRLESAKKGPHFEAIFATVHFNQTASELGSGDF